MRHKTTAAAWNTNAYFRGNLLGPVFTMALKIDPPLFATK